MGIKLDLAHMRKIAGLPAIKESVDMEMDMGDDQEMDSAEDMGMDDAEGAEGHEFGDEQMDDHVAQESHVFDEACEILERAKEFCKTELEHCEEQDRCEQYHKILGACEHLCEMMQEHVQSDGAMGNDDMSDEMSDEQMPPDEEMPGEEGGEGSDEMPPKEQEEMGMGMNTKMGAKRMHESKAPMFAAGGKSSKTMAKKMMPTGKSSMTFKKAPMKKMPHQMKGNGKPLVK